MSEIERAIDDFNNYVEMGYGQYFRPSSESTELALTALEEKLEREKNEPMTWKELVSAETTPVYIRNLEHKEESMWAVVGNEYDKIGFTFVNLYDETERDCGCKELYGETWIAYRYEPKGEPNV